MDIEQLELRQAWCEAAYECKAIVAVGGQVLGVMARTVDGRNIVADSQSRVFTVQSDEEAEKWELSPLYDDPAGDTPTFGRFCERCEALMEQSRQSLQSTVARCSRLP